MDWELLFIVLLAVGAIQGVVLGVLLLSAKAKQVYPNRILAVLLYFLSYQLITEILAAVGVIHTETFLYHIFLEFYWAYGALIFFYVISFLNPNWRIGRKDWLHFLPLAIEFCIGNFVKMQNLYWDGTTESLSWLGLQGYIIWVQTPLQEVAGSVLIFGYSLAGMRRVDQYAQSFPARAHKMSWIKPLLIMYQAIAVLLASWSMIDYLLFDYAFNPSYFYPAYISIAVLTYVLGLIGFAHRDDAVEGRGRWQTKSSQEWTGIFNAFKGVVKENHLYRKPALSLNEVAEQLKVKPYQLTEALNGAGGVTFKEYINACRVEEVIRLMQEPDYEQYTLTAIAFEAGFNSKASFNRMFKKVTGKSPSTVKKELRAKSTR